MKFEIVNDTAVQLIHTNISAKVQKKIYKWPQSYKQGPSGNRTMNKADLQNLLSVYL